MSPSPFPLMNNSKGNNSLLRRWLYVGITDVPESG